MNLNISTQYKKLQQEKEDLKKRFKKVEEMVLYLGKYLKHVEDIKAARKEKKLIPMEEVFREFNI